MIPVKVSDHENQGFRKLIQLFQETTNTPKILQIFMSEIQRLEDELFVFLDRCLLPPFGSADGRWIDLWGVRVGERRGGRSDADYLQAIRLRARANRSQGRSLDLVEIASLGGTQVEYSEFGVGSWQISIAGVPQPKVLAQILLESDALTSKGSVIVGPEVGFFALGNAAGTDPWDDSNGLQNALNPASPGGELAVAY